MKKRRSAVLNLHVPFLDEIPDVPALPFDVCFQNSLYAATPQLRAAYFRKLNDREQLTDRTVPLVLAMLTDTNLAARGWILSIIVSMASDGRLHWNGSTCLAVSLAIAREAQGILLPWGTAARSLLGDPLVEAFAAQWLCDNPQPRGRCDRVMRRTCRAILTHREPLWCWLF